MNKKELIAKLAEVMGTTKKDAEAALDAVTTVITNALVEGNDVKITGFGNFSVTERAARIGRNPLTGAEVQIQASKSPKFKAAKALKDAVNA